MMMKLLLSQGREEECGQDGQVYALAKRCATMQRRSVGLYRAANFELREVLEGMLTSIVQLQQRECSK
jgi:hypothetical protein